MPATRKKGTVSPLGLNEVDNVELVISDISDETDCDSQRIPDSGWEVIEKDEFSYKRRERRKSKKRGGTFSDDFFSAFQKRPFFQDRLNSYR